MNNRRTVLMILLLISCGVSAFFVYFEKYEKTIDLGWGEEARKNPYLAAQYFIEKKQVSVDSYSSLERLDNLPENGTIILSDSSHVFSKEMMNRLLEWLENGGHLIVAAPDPSSDAVEILLEHFSIESVESDYSEEVIEEEIEDTDGSPDDEAIDQEEEKETKFSERLRQANIDIDENKELVEEPGIKDEIAEFEKSIPDSNLTLMTFQGYENTVRAHYIHDYVLYHPYFSVEDPDAYLGYKPFYWSGDEYGTHMMQFYIEEGLLTVMSDIEIWESSEIKYFEHAKLLDILITHDNAVNIIYGMQKPSLFTLMFRYAYELLLAFSLWLVAWLIYKGQRFGSVRKFEVTTRRSMKEHVHANAAYCWRGKFQDLLLNPVKKEIQTKASYCFTDYSLLTEDEQYQRLSECSGVNLADVKRLMNINNRLNEEEYLLVMQHMQKIRKSL